MKVTEEGNELIIDFKGSKLCDTIRIKNAKMESDFPPNPFSQTCDNIRISVDEYSSGFPIRLSVLNDTTRGKDSHDKIDADRPGDILTCLDAIYLANSLYAAVEFVKKGMEKIEL